VDSWLLVLSIVILTKVRIPNTLNVSQFLFHPGLPGETVETVEMVEMVFVDKWIS